LLYSFWESCWQERRNDAIKKNNNNFIERSVTGALSFLKESVFAEEYASKKGFLQARDPRFKAAAALLLLISVMLAKTIPFLAVMYLFCLSLACFSGIGLRFFLKRTWVFIPLFSLFIAIPALFSFISPGDALWSFSVFGLKFTITRQGLFGAATFVLRVTTSVSFVILLALTARHTELLRVLQVFKVPRIFVMTMGMCYRYLYLFIGIVENTYLAIKSRIGSGVHHKKGREIVAWNIANLWQRSYQLSDQVYGAMLSRGYRGEYRTLNEFRATSGDWLLIGIAALFFALMIGANRAGMV